MTEVFDVLLDPAGDLPISPVHVTGIRRIAQKIRLRLLTHRGEWLKDTTIGVPYQEWILDLMDDIPTIGGFIRQTIESCPGVLRVEGFTCVKSGETVSVSATIVSTKDERAELRVSVSSEFGNFEPIVMFHFAAGVIG
ncbi:MAG TPA: hypothetical protein VLB27_08670 [candidate division Zixibacteria bacterium]|nr:hypothetical protein [candidate division Zixibacteria bacterium]